MTEPQTPRVKLPANVPVPTSGPRARDLLYGRRFAIANTQRAKLVDHAAFYCRLPRVSRRDRYDYPKFVIWHYASVGLERVWCLADRPCAGSCGWSIAAHTFYVRVHDYARTRRIGSRLNIPTQSDYHPACVPADYAPALLRLEVPE